MYLIDCTFNMVTSAMNNAANVEDIVEKWRKIANHLGVKKDVINKIDRKIDRDNWTALDIMDELLRSWRSFASIKATLDVLIEKLNNHGLKDISVEIKKAFKLPDDDDSSQGNAQLQTVFVPQVPVQMPQLMQGQVPLMQGAYQHVLPQGAIGYTYPGTLIPNILPQENLLYKTNTQD